MSSSMHSVSAIFQNGKCDKWWENEEPDLIASVIDAAGNMLDAARAQMQDDRPLTGEEFRRFMNTKLPELQGAPGVRLVITETIACEIEEDNMDDCIVKTATGLKLFVRVCHSKKLTYKTHVEGYKRTLHQLIRDTRANCGMFVSLATVSVPNSGPGACGIECMTDTDSQLRIPVIFVATDSRSTLQVAIKSVLNLQIMCAKEAIARGAKLNASDADSLRNELLAFQRATQPLATFVSESSVDTRIEMLQRLLNDATLEKSRRTELLYVLSRLRTQVDWNMDLQDSEDREDKMNSAVQMVNEMYDRRHEIPKTSEMNPSQRQLIKQAGGLKAVLSRAKLPQPKVQPTDD